MKNRYLFFNAETFEDIDLRDYAREDTKIPETDVHIYTFAYASIDESINDEFRAKKLDELTQLIAQKYEGKFQVVSSGSSQYFCDKLYPLLAEFETHLRYALYISRAVYNSDNLETESFFFDVEDQKQRGKMKRCKIENMVFSEIYTSIFTDTSLKSKIQSQYNAHLTKAELIKRIEAIPEETIWHKWVGNKYTYVENHFLEIKNYRNDVMHSHLISYACYIEAKKNLQRAIDEIECVIHDKLITNNSEYAKKTNLFDLISGMVKAAEIVGSATEEINSPQIQENMKRTILLFSKLAHDSTALSSGELAKQNNIENYKDEQDKPQEDLTQRSNL